MDMDILVSRTLYMSCQAGPGIRPGPSALSGSALPIELTWRTSWSSNWSSAFNTKLHTFLHPVLITFPHHMSLPSQSTTSMTVVIGSTPTSLLISLFVLLSYQKLFTHPYVSPSTIRSSARSASLIVPSQRLHLKLSATHNKSPLYRL